MDYAIKNSSNDISIDINDNSMLTYLFKYTIPFKRTIKIEIQLQKLEQDPIARLEGKIVKNTN